MPLFVWCFMLGATWRSCGACLLRCSRNELWTFLLQEPTVSWFLLPLEPFLLRLKRKLLGNCSTDFVFSWSRRVCSRNLCVHVFIHQAIVTAVLHRAVQRQVLFEIQTQVARISKQSYNVPLCFLTFPWPFDQLGHLTVEHRQVTGSNVFAASTTARQPNVRRLERANVMSDSHRVLRHFDTENVEVWLQAVKLSSIVKLHAGHGI